jgi:hypothetical protein
MGRSESRYEPDERVAKGCSQPKGLESNFDENLTIVSAVQESLRKLLGREA